MLSQRNSVKVKQHALVLCYIQLIEMLQHRTYHL